MLNLNNSQRDSLVSIANELEVPSLWLERIIKYESGGDPLVKNPYSSARGLIQFMDATAKDMGFIDSLNLVQEYPTFETQLEEPVFEYFKRYAPFKNEAEFYLAVFYPALRKKDLNYIFPSSIQEPNTLNINGVKYPIKTPAHYVAYVKGKLPEYSQGEVLLSDIVDDNNWGLDSDIVVSESEVEVINPAIEPNKKRAPLFIGVGVGIVLFWYMIK